MCVRKHLVSIQLCTVTWESTPEINHWSVHCVTKVSANPAACSDINVVYTATEDRMTVLTVGSCLRQTLNWSFMFLFTLVQSRSHVDTVHSVLQGVANSRHICWSHTMKVLGWHVTFVRKKISERGNLKQHLLRHEGVKPYVCSQCPKRFCTVFELKHHQPVHSDYKQFCCGLYGKDFKHKRYVVEHFKSCSSKLKFSNN